MLVFKTYFKIIKKQMPQLSIYIVIFLSLAVVFTFFGSGGQIDKFTQSKTRVAFINEDENSVLIQGFKNYLGNYSDFVKIENSRDKLQDALFFRDVEYIVKIPAGFTNAIMAGRDAQVDKTVVTGSIDGIYTDMLVNRYFNNARLFINSDGDISQEELVAQLDRDLKTETDVQLKSFGGKSEDANTAKYYFNYLAYILICIIVLGVSSIMMVFNNINLKRRNLCAPVKNISINLWLLLGNIIFALICWVMAILLSLILFRERMFSMAGLYFCLNSLVFTFTTLSLAFMAGILIKSRNAQAGVSNVVSLGMSFLSGVFVPQEFIGENVLAIARFTPTYWYVKAGDDIGNLTVFSLDNVAPIITCMLVELGFAVAFVSVALVISKRKQLKGV